MNCQKFEEVINDIAREQLMDAGLRGQGLAHTRECVQCGQRLEDERSLTSRLRGLAAAIGSIDPPETLPDRLFAEFDRLPLQPRRRRVGISRSSWVAIAAALLLVLGALFGTVLRRRSSIPVKPADQVLVTNHQAQPEKVSEPVANVPAPGPNTPARMPTLLAGKHARRPGVNDSAASGPIASHHSREIATNFFLINYSAVTLAEGGRVIRVSLPRSAMARFGLPVNMDRANEPVKADLVLGIDNRPQAIRFVQEMASADGPNSRQSPAPPQADARKPRKEKKS